MQRNPFTYGNPITDPRRFVGRAREVEQIFGRLRNEEFESSSLVGDRRVGKTSLLNYLSGSVVRAAYGLGPEHYLFVYVDLEMVDETMGPEQLWRRLLALMRRNSGHQNISDLVSGLEKADRLDTFALDEFFQELDESGQHVLFLLDEFEHVTSNANFGPDFYYGLRSLILHHHVALVTSSRLELIELCHSDAIKSSPFFNIFANVNLRLFSRDDSELLISRSLDGTGVAFSGDETARVFDLGGRHPYFLQVACWALYEAYRKGLDQSGRISLLAEQFRLEAIPHFTDYWDNSDDYEKIVLTAAALLEQSASAERTFSITDLHRLFARSEPTVQRLEKRGLLMSEGGRYQLFSSMLGPWIITQLAAEISDEQGYHEWLAENRGPVERVTGKQGGALRDILPRIRVNYRQLILTWASDPQAIGAVAGLLKAALAMAT